MPRNVRNFWIELYVDGKKTMVKTGPKRKDGGFMLTIYQRDQGSVKKMYEVFGTVSGDEKNETLATSFYDCNAKAELFARTTKR